jgi:predicted  nucleic acid-binding Zn-ribbon protein
MNPELERLVELQRAETELRRVQVELARIPQQKAEIDQRLAQERSRLEAAREAMATSQKARRQHESGLQDLEGKRSKYKGQLMEVKTNKEYTAMLHEIEAVEREIRGTEDRILVEMEKAEELGQAVKHEEQLFKEIEQRHQGEARQLDERSRALQSELGTLQAARDASASTLSDDWRARFQRVAKLRGTAVAEARDGMCQECHVKLRLQMYSELKRNDEIMECPQCNRILYYVPPVPVSAPQP